MADLFENPFSEKQSKKIIKQVKMEQQILHELSDEVKFQYARLLIYSGTSEMDIRRGIAYLRDLEEKQSPELIVFLYYLRYYLIIGTTRVGDYNEALCICMMILNTDGQEDNPNVIRLKEYLLELNKMDLGQVPAVVRSPFNNKRLVAVILAAAVGLTLFVFVILYHSALCEPHAENKEETDDDFSE